MKQGFHSLRIRNGIQQRILKGIISRPFSDDCITNHSSNDHWSKTFIKSGEFYEKHASHHRYFYNIDLQGRLFMEDVYPKNISTSLKDVRFLNFFFRNIRRSSREEMLLLDDDGASQDYPFVSLCANEINYIRPVDQPFVFHDMYTKSDGQCDLIYGTSWTHPFSPGHIYISRKTHRLYHELIPSKQSTKLKLHASKIKEFGLIKSSLAVKIAYDFVERQCQASNDNDDYTDIEIVVSDHSRDNHINFKVRWLPQYAESD